MAKRLFSSASASKHLYSLYVHDWHFSCSSAWYLTPMDSISHARNLDLHGHHLAGVVQGDRHSPVIIPRELQMSFSDNIHTDAVKWCLFGNPSSRKARTATCHDRLSRCIFQHPPSQGRMRGNRTSPSSKVRASTTYVIAAHSDLITWPCTCGTEMVWRYAWQQLIVVEHLSHHHTRSIRGRYA